MGLFAKQSVESTQYTIAPRRFHSFQGFFCFGSRVQFHVKERTTAKAGGVGSEGSGGGIWDSGA